jgi:hypothetical protein
MERDGTAPVKSRGTGAPERLGVPLPITKTGKESVNLRWHKHAAGHWFPLGEVDLDGLGNAYGVFIIWRNGQIAKVSTVLYVGRGRLKTELAECRRSPLFCSAHLRVTWAVVDSPEDLDGIATYLYQHLRPLWGEVMSSTAPVPVNLPLTA